MADPQLSTREVFERSYVEVLSALKHQDDKLNRTLTALAFLTAAGVTLYLALERNPPLSDTMRFAEGGPPVTSVMFVVFLSTVAVALLTALTAIGPGAPLRLTGEPATSDPDKSTGNQASTKAEAPYTGSLLFYARIANDEGWKQRLAAADGTTEDKHVEKLNKQLAGNYHDEAQLIAQRVTYKVARSRESGAFVQLAILALTLLGIFEARALGDPARWWVASALIVLVLAIPFWDRKMIKKYDYATVAGSRAYQLLAVSVLLAGGLLVAAELSAAYHWWALAYALFLMLVSRLAIVSRQTASTLLWLAPFPGVLLLASMLAWA